MDDFTSTSKAVVGMPTERAWAQTFSFDGLFGVMSLSGENTVSLSVVGKDLLDTLEREYINLAIKNLSSFNVMVESIVEKSAGLNLCLVLAVCVGKTLYLVGRGGGQALLCRGQKQVIILSSTSHSTSGLLESLDTLIIFTKGFFEHIPLEKLRSSLDHLPLEAICDALAPFISGTTNSSLAASLFVRFTKEGGESYDSFNPMPSQSKLATETVYPFLFLGKLISYARNILFALKKKLNGLIFFKTRFINQRFFHKKLKTKEEGMPDLPDDIYIHRQDGVRDKSRRTLLTVGLFLVALFLASAVFGINKRSREEKLAGFTNLYNLSEIKFNEGKALLELNPVRARTLLSDSKNAAEKARTTVLKDKKELTKVDRLLKDINSAIEGVAGVYRFSDAPTFFDLSVLKEKGSGSKLALNNKKLVVLDSMNNSVYSMGVDGKGAEIIAGGAENFSNSKFISLHGDFAYVLSDKGVIEVNVPIKSSKVAVKRDEDWGEVVAMSEFGAFKGNIYIFDKKNSRILKYTSIENDFLPTKDYLATDTKPNLSNGISMVIDGSVWVLSSDGKMFRFTSGKPDFFSMTGLDVPFSLPTVLYTDEDSKNLYVLDRGNKRIVVFDKDKKLGEYVSQYVWDGLGDAADFVVDEENKKMFILLGSKIITINLR